MQTNNKQAWIMGLVTGIALVIITLGVVYYFQKSQTPIVGVEENTQTTEVSTTTNKEQSTAPVTQVRSETDDLAMSDWKTYSNKRFGYELMYPPEWKLAESENFTSIVITKADGSRVVVVMYLDGRDGGPQGTRSYTTTVNGYKAVRTDYPTITGEIFESAIRFSDSKLFNEDNTHEIRISAAAQQQLVYTSGTTCENCTEVQGRVNDFATLEKILSTFKFI